MTFLALNPVTTLDTVAIVGTEGQPPGAPFGAAPPGGGLIVGLLLVVLIVALFASAGRRRARFRYMMANGAGPCGGGAARSAEQSLAERFAEGKIDATDYEARVKVLRETREIFPGYGLRRRQKKNQ